MSEPIHFEARKWAGEFPLTRHDGEKKTVHIRVMDKALYDHFREMESNIREQASNVDENDPMAKARLGEISTDLSYNQLLELCPDLTEDDLVGFDLLQIREMFQYVTKVAYGINRTDEQKKNQSNTGSKSSGSRRRGRPSKRLQASGE